jgi:hypothetical protein
MIPVPNAAERNPSNPRSALNADREHQKKDFGGMSTRLDLVGSGLAHYPTWDTVSLMSTIARSWLTEFPMKYILAI